MTIDLIHKHIERNKKGNRIYFDIMTEIDLMAMVLKNNFNVEVKCTHVEENKLKTLVEYKTSTTYVILDLDREIKKICKRIIEATFNETRSDVIRKMDETRVKNLYLLSKEDQDEYTEIRDAVRKKITDIFKDGSTEALSIAGEAKANCTTEDLENTIYMILQNEYGAKNSDGDLYNSLFRSSPDKTAEIYKIYLEADKRAESFFEEFRDYSRTLVEKIKEIKQRKDEEKAIEDIVNQRSISKLSSKLKNFLEWS